jgi:hypothetical protein
MTADLNNTGTTRPQFLTILCILSFVMCGLMILSSAFNIAFSFVADSMGFDGTDKNTALDHALNFAANTRANSIKELVVQLVSLAGVLLMWRLMKWGFFVYVLAEIFVYFEFLYVATTMNINMQEVRGAGLELFWPIPFDIAFIIMYATQLKFMHWKNKAVLVVTQAGFSR